jgi:transposase
MLSRPLSPRQSCFLTPPWDELHPDWLALDRRLEPLHPARLLCRLVETLDLQPLLDSYAGRGSLAFPPALLVAFVLLMIQRNCLSPAQWARTARRDDEAKWLLRGLVPSRALLYHFRDRLAPFVAAWHRQIVLLAITLGFCDPHRAALDGTLIPSFASRHRLVVAATVQRRLGYLLLLAWMRDGLQWVADSAAAADQRAVLLLTWLVFLLLLAAVGLLGWLLLGVLPGWVATSGAGRLRQLHQYSQTQARLEGELQVYQQRQRQLAKKRRLPPQRRPACLTDLEAALGRDKLGLFRPLYNVLVLTSLEGDWVLDIDVLARPTDQGLLPPMLRHARHEVGIEVKEVAVDEGFVNLLDLQECKEAGVVVYAPAAVDQEPAEGKVLPKGAFRWEAAEQVYYCPQGHKLEPKRRTKAKRQRPEGRVELPVIVYACAAAHCLACPQQAACTKTPQSGRLVKRLEGEEVVEELRQRMSQPASQRLYKERKKSVERGNAEIKEHRGLRQFRSYGQRRAQTQALLVGLCMNGLRLEKRLAEGEAQPPGEPPKQAA